MTTVFPTIGRWLVMATLGFAVAACAMRTDPQPAIKEASTDAAQPVEAADDASAWLAQANAGELGRVLTVAMKADGYERISKSRNTLVFEKPACRIQSEDQANPRPDPSDDLFALFFSEADGKQAAPAADGAGASQSAEATSLPTCDSGFAYFLSDMAPEGPFRRIAFTLQQQGAGVRISVNAFYHDGLTNGSDIIRASDDELYNSWLAKAVSAQPARSQFGLSYYLTGPGLALSKGWQHAGDWLQAHHSVGAVVAEIVPGATADQAGIGISDVIVALDDKPIFSSVDFFEVTRNRSPDTIVMLTVIRDNQELVLPLVLGEPAREQERPSS